MTTPVSTSSQSAPVAAFDMDGAITWADAFTTFLRRRCSRGAFRARASSLTPLFSTLAAAKATD